MPPARTLQPASTKDLGLHIHLSSSWAYSHRSRGRETIDPNLEIPKGSRDYLSVSHKPVLAGRQAIEPRLQS